MRRPPGDPLLTTRQVAEMCATNEETIRYFAQTAVLRGHVAGDGWEFLLSDAQPFCEAWGNEKARRRSAGAGGGPGQSTIRRAGGFGVDFVNFGASVVSLAAAFGLDGNRVVGIALAALNVALGALHGVWATVRRRGRDDAIAGEAVDPDAVAWASGDGGMFPLRGLQVACLVATVGFVAVTSLRSIQVDQVEPTAAPPAPTQVSTTNDAPGTCSNMPVYEVGATARTTRDVNLRKTPGTDSESVAVLPTGTQVQITGEFAEGGQCDWWPVVTESGHAGFLLEQYLEPSA